MKAMFAKPVPESSAPQAILGLVGFGKDSTDQRCWCWKGLSVDRWSSLMGVYHHLFLWFSPHKGPSRRSTSLARSICRYSEQLMPSHHAFVVFSTSGTFGSTPARKQKKTKRPPTRQPALQGSTCGVPSARWRGAPSTPAARPGRAGRLRRDPASGGDPPGGVAQQASYQRESTRF